MTTYDKVYRLFITICKTDGFNLPETSGDIYDLIHSAVIKYNNVMRDNLDYEDSKEEFSRELDNDEMLILANFIKLIFLENDLTYYTTIFSGFTKEIGLKNYSATSKAKQSLVEKQKNIISDLIFNSDDSTIM